MPRRARRPKFRRQLISSSGCELLESRLFLSVNVNPSPRLAGTINRTDDDGVAYAYLPPTRVLQDVSTGFISAPRRGKPLDVARQYISAHVADLGLRASDVTGAIVTDQYTDQPSGVTHVYLRQSFNGLPVVGAEMGVHLAADNRVISVTSSFIAGLGDKQTGKAPATKLAAKSALPLAASALHLNTSKGTTVVTAGDGTTITDPKLSLDPIPAQARYYATADGVRLGWGFVVRPPNHNGDWYDVAVSADDGSLLFASNWTDHLAQYDVYPQPTEAPNDGSRQVVADPSDALASPFGWHDTNGVAGAEFTTTVGNNVSAQEDTDASDTGGFRPDGGAALNFDFPIDLTQAPSTYQSAAITNLFYWNNIVHDVHYHFGFTEVAGNFQTNNYGRGGAGNDAVQADAQDGSGTNNANFGTPPDGSPGRMQMYLFTSTSPNRDGDLDAMVITHEFGHGVSNRLTGGPGNASALDATQSGGMGEGWSDLWSLLFTQKPSDTLTGSFGVGTYVKGQPNTGGGIRRFPYSYNMSVDPLTIDAYGTSGTSTISGGVTRSTEVHATGELWNSALWDMAVLLEQKYGFDANLYTGYTAAAGPGHAGNKLAWQLVLDAMKLQPANPSFSQARDAILLADQNLTGGANQTEIWTAFARRGMGFSFNDGGSSSATSVTAGFNMPPADPVVMRQSPVSTKINVAPVGSMSFTFLEPIDPASVSLTDDVVFTGPGGTNLAASLTGFSTSSGNRVLTINFTPVTTPGTYTMTIGPNVLAADDGHAMDQNTNGTPGEAADKYTGTFIYNTMISETGGVGYKAAPWTFENLDLVPGAAGVTSIITNGDDSSGGSAVINLGTDVFRLYTTNYTGNSTAGANASDNGFVSFGASSTVSANTDMTSPSAARFAALWDDWYTQVNAADQVLYRFDDLNGDGTRDRLVVEWNAVNSFAAPGNPVTFQAIFQLNTGTTPGVMIANYVDLDTGDPFTSNGASSTVGIKDIGTPPTNKMLVTQDDGTFPWVGDGKAIRIATDWTAPTVSGSNFVNPSGGGGGAMSLTYTFSENVGASLTPASLVLVNTTTSQTIPTASIAKSYNAGTNTVTFTFPGFANGRLPVGSYSASLVGVTDAQWMPLSGSSAANFVVQPNGVWTGAGDGVNWTTAGNWSNSVVPSASDDVLINVAANPNIVVSGSQSVRSVTSAEDLSISGSLSVAQASSFAGVISVNTGGSLGGAGAITIDGSLAMAGGSLVGSGAVVVSTSATLNVTAPGATASARPITLNGAGAIAPGGDKVLNLTGGLTLGAGATLDLNDNDMIVDYNVTSPITSIQAAINSARAGGAWTGLGITSSSAKNNASHNTTLGVLESAQFDSLYTPTTPFDGIDPDATAVLVKYTYYGDANFSGTVTFDDYVKIDTGFNAHTTGWLNGDFNGDGAVNFDDYVLIDTSFNNQGPVL